MPFCKHNRVTGKKRSGSEGKTHSLLPVAHGSAAAQAPNEQSRGMTRIARLQRGIGRRRVLGAARSLTSRGSGPRASPRSEGALRARPSLSRRSRERAPAEHHARTHARTARAQHALRHRRSGGGRSCEGALASAGGPASAAEHAGAPRRRACIGGRRVRYARLGIAREDFLNVELPESLRQIRIHLREAPAPRKT